VIEELSLAAPAYREGAGIEAVVERWVGYLAPRFAPDRFEIVICDDGSDDDTGKVLAKISSRHPQLTVVTHPRNQGAAAALANAIAHTTKRWVLLIDSDGQFPIENLERLEAALDGPPPDAVLGVRHAKKDTRFTQLGSWASAEVCNRLHGSHLRDFNSAFKLVRGDLLRSFCLEAKGLNYSTEITSRLLEQGASLKEVEIDHRPRASGTSSMRLVKGSLHRLLFVSYLGYRQFLLARGVLRRTGQPR
jgi:dolichol-phosphate mannosyltransferase